MTRSCIRCRDPSGVSMKSGLEDRNNIHRGGFRWELGGCLNEVRPGRPEQWDPGGLGQAHGLGVSMKSGLEDRNNDYQCSPTRTPYRVSMKSGLEDRNNGVHLHYIYHGDVKSQ